MKLMLIEDEYLLNKTIKTYLVSKHFIVDNFTDGLLALDNIENGYDLFIIDIDLPKITGIEILEHIRTIYPLVPVIIISATIDMDMITKAYTKGCNDYLKKPFDIKELALKINALTRFISDEIELSKDFFYNTKIKNIKYKDERIPLTNFEAKFMDLLNENRGHPVSNEYIESMIWGSNISHLRQLVNRLRNKLPEDIIQNRMGEGYFIA